MKEESRAVFKTVRKWLALSIYLLTNLSEVDEKTTMQSKF